MTGRAVAVVGGGGLGREIRDYLADAGCDFAGFIDDNAAVADRLGGVADASTLDVDVLLGVGSVEARLSLIARLGTGVTYVALIHPTAVVSPSAQIGAGALVGPFCMVGPGAQLGNHSILNVNCMIGHDGVLGDAAVVSPHVVLAGGSTIGAGCFLGSSSVIFQGVSVGAQSVVSAGSMVSKDVPAESFVAGNPARSMPRQRIA